MQSREGSRHGEQPRRAECRKWRPAEHATGEDVYAQERRHPIVEEAMSLCTTADAEKLTLSDESTARLKKSLAKDFGGQRLIQAVLELLNLAATLDDMGSTDAGGGELSR